MVAGLMLTTLTALAACGAPAARSPVRCQDAPWHSPAEGDAGAPALGEPMATLHRGACLGTCPAYVVSIYRDGTVRYEGRQFVKTKGRAVGHIPAADVDALERVFVAADWYALRDSYSDGTITDVPDAVTTYASNGRTKTIVHDPTDRSAPRALDAVEHAIDLLAHVEQWTGTEQERSALFPCP